MTAVVKILQDSVTVETSYELHCHFFEYVCEFELKIWEKKISLSLLAKILVCLMIQEIWCNYIPFM
jgi:hypothetical protein